MLAVTNPVSAPCSDVSEYLLKQLEAKITGLVTGESGETTMAPVSEATAAAIYHLGSVGKRIRGQLAIHAGVALNLSENDTLCIAATCELLHNASLIHDDLQDGDELRRGRPAVWSKFGSNVAVCTGDLMLSSAYAALCLISDLRVIPDLLALVHNRTASAISGQCADLRASDGVVSDIDTYRRIVIAKSGALLSLPFELALTICDKRSRIGYARAAAEAFSIAYQVADDLNDVDHDTQTRGFNIVSVVDADVSSVAAVTRARHFGGKHLDIAVAAAQQLPGDMGVLLLRLCDELRASFTSRNK
jgi:geranylgeranyl pyrophosphate synthase